jgi:hypothetical protein
MWFDPTDAATVHQEAIRHEAQQGDKLSSYGWVRHDGRSYGRQEIADGDFQLSVQMVSMTAAVRCQVCVVKRCELSSSWSYLQKRDRTDKAAGQNPRAQCCCVLGSWLLNSVLSLCLITLPHHMLCVRILLLPLCALPAPPHQLKHASEGSGFGGDWAVRMSVSLTPAGKAKQEAAKAAAEAEGRQPAKRKLSLVFYFADAHWRTSELEMWPEQQQSKLGQVRRGLHALMPCEAWQTHQQPHVPGLI